MPIKDAQGITATPFNYGGGHLNVNAALDPGLVYGITVQDYKNFQCTPTGGFSRYCSGNKRFREIDLNLPSLSLFNLTRSVSVTRRLTLVGKPATYKVVVVEPAGVKVRVKPEILEFRKYGQSLEYEISVDPVAPYTSARVDYETAVGFTFGTILWSDGVRVIKLNLAVNVP